MESKKSLLFKYLLVMPILSVAAVAQAQSSGLGLDDFSGARQSQASYRKLEPKSSEEFYSDEDEQELEEITDRGIEELSRLIDRFEDSPNRGELWLRLAELYVEKARIADNREQRRFDQAVKDHNTGGKGPAPKLDEDEARTYNLKAAEYYKKFVKAFPRDPKVDKALFFLGYTYFEMNKINEGARFYKLLTQKYKSSPYVSESSFALAEYHFEREEWKSALGYYREVAKDKEARLYIFALYKAGWCFYRMNMIDRAFSVMERVLIESRIAKRDSELAGRKKVNRLRLAAEALRDLIPFYADSGRDYRQAFDYFAKTAGDKQAFTMVERLAYYYSDSGNKEAARYLFSELIKQQPNSPRAFDYQYHIVTNYIASGKDDVFQRELVRWVEKYSKGGQWYQTNESNPEMIQDAEVMREAALRNFVLQVHQTAKNSRQPYSQKVAQEGYSLYIRAFPKSEKSTLMHFYHAELLFDMKRYGEAATEYIWVIENDPSSGYVEPAMINSAIALEKQLPSEKAIIKKVGKSVEPVPFDEKIKAFEKAGLLYLEKFPQGNRRDRIRFKIARLHYLHNHFDEALEGFRQVQKDTPKSKLGEYSANLILDILKIRNDYEGIQREGKKLLSANLSPQLEGEIQSIIEESSFKSAETLEKAGSYKESAQSYESFARANPGSPLALTAIFNAGVNYSRAGEALLAISVLNTLHKDSGKEKPEMKRQAREKLIDLYLQTGQYIPAAQMYETMAKVYPDDAKRGKYLFNAAIIWDDLAVWKYAYQNYQEALRASSVEDREKILFASAELWFRQGRKAEAIKAYQYYLSQRPVDKENIVKAHFQIARLQDLSGLEKEAKDSYWRTISVQRSVSTEKPIGLPYAAESRFYLALPYYMSFVALRFPENPEGQQKVVAEKLQGLDRLTKEMEDVVKVGDPTQNIAALTLIGKANWHIGQFFKLAPMPKDLSADEQKEYRQKLSEQAAPFLKIAVENFEKAVESSQKNERYSIWIDSAKSGLASIDPKKYSFAEEEVKVESEIDWMGL